MRQTGDQYGAFSRHDSSTGSLKRSSGPPEFGFCTGIFAPPAAAAGTPHSALTTGATGALRSASAKSPWKTWWSSAGRLGMASAKTLAIPAVSGAAAEITDRETWETVRAQVIADFGELWPEWDSLALFELSVASCLLTLTEPDGTFPKGPTVWKA